MPDASSSGFGINVGDAILTFLGDTTDLERAWTEMEDNSTASATRTVNEVLRQYDRLGIEGSAKLNQAAEQAQEAFNKLTDSGVASMSDLIQAEQAVIEKQIALKNSLGESIPTSVIERLESLKLQYVGLTGTVEEFDAAQLKSVAYLERNSFAIDQDSIAARRLQVELDKAIATSPEYVAAKIAEAEADKKAAQAKKGNIGVSSDGGSAIAEGLGSVAATAQSLALYAGIAAVAGSLADGVKQALSFDAAFTELTTVIQEKTPQSAQVIQMLKDQLLSLPPTLGNITDLTHGVYQALSAGIPAAEAVSVVAKSATLARAGLADLETTTKLVTQTMNAYGLTARDTDSVTSALMATIQVGVLRLPDLAANLGKVTPIAAELGVTFPEVTGALSSLTAGGLDAAEASTALRGVLITLEGKSKETEKSLGEVGLSAAKLRAEVADKGLNVAMGELASKITDTNLATQIFGNVRAQLGFEGLAAQGSKYAGAVADISQAYKDANLAQIEFNKINQSLDGQLKTLGNTISNDFVGGFQKAEPALIALGVPLKGLVVDSGLLKIAIGALLAVFYVLDVSLSAAAAAVYGVKTAVTAMALGFVEASGYITGLGTLSQNAVKSISSLRDSLHESEAGAKGSARSISLASEAIKNYVTGNDKATDSQKKFSEAQLKLAEAQDRVTEANKKMSDAASAAARAHQDSTGKTDEETKASEKLEKQAAKTAEAMKSYGQAHGISFVPELEANTVAAEKFFNTMRSGKEPMASQIAAAINLNIQMGKLQQLLNDKRSIGEQLSDIGKGANFKPLEAEIVSVGDMYEEVVDRFTGISSKVKLEITDPLVTSFNTVLEAERKLGIEGTASLVQKTNEQRAAVQVLREEYVKGTASSADMARAEEKLAETEKKLADDMYTAAQAQLAKQRASESKAGVEGGVGDLTAQRNDTQEALKGLQELQKQGLETAEVVQQAELKALEADKALKQALGQPVPDAMNQSILKLTNSLSQLRDKMVQSKDTNQQWYDFWHKEAPSAAGNISAITDMGKEAFLNFSSSFGSVVQSVESGQKSITAAIREAVSQQLEAISGQAAVQALYALAQALFYSFTDPPAAAAYYAAAAEFGAVAAASGIAGAALGGGGAAGSSSGSSSSSVSGATQIAVNPVNVQNVQRFGSGGLVTGRTLAMIGDSKNNAGQNASEAVLPLDDPQSMSKLRAGLGSGGGGDTYIIQGLLSADTLDKTMDAMSSRVKSGKTLVASHSNRLVKKS